jgi:hypothetical protein
LATGQVPAGRIASEAEISRAAVVETETRLEEVLEDTTDRMLALEAAAAPPAWHHEAEEASVVVAEA